LIVSAPWSQASNQPPNWLLEKKGQEEASIFPFDKGEVSDLYFLTMLTITLNQGQKLKDRALAAWPILAAFKEDTDFHSSPEN